MCSTTSTKTKTKTKMKMKKKKNLCTNHQTQTLPPLVVVQAAAMAAIVVCKTVLNLAENNFTLNTVYIQEMR